MAVFSKPISITPSCYELGHCWTPYCSMASLDVGKGIFSEALKIYGTLYVVAAIFKRKGFKHYLTKVIPETLRSSIFLTVNGTSFIAMFCFWRILLGGRFYYLTISFLPSFIGSIMAVLIERKIRRGPLAVYLSNLAIETWYRMLVERGMFKPIPHGEVYLFSAVSAIYLYLFRQRGGLPSSAKSLFSFFLGKSESPRDIEPSAHELPASSGESSTQPSVPSTSSASSSSSSSSSSSHLPESNNNDNETSRNISQPPSSSSSSSSSTPVSSSSKSSPPPSSLSRYVQTISKSLCHIPLLDQCLSGLRHTVGGAMTWLEAWPKHHCCPHSHSCLSYITKGGASMFAFGYSVQAIISTLSSLTAILRHPAAVKNTLVSKANLKLAAFLASYNAIFRAVNCLLRWIRNKDEEIHGMVAGALAGLSLRFYKSVTVALYAATKLVEILYFKGIGSHGLPHIPNADIFIYAVSTAFIFHAAVMEPHTLRPGYWKFLLRVTHNKFAFMNRRLLDVFGVNSSKLYPDYWPDYDKRFTSLAPPPS